MRVRPLSAAAAVVLAAAGLSSCRTNVGAAATVFGQRITESQVSAYVTPTGPASSAAAQAAQAGTTISPKAQVLQVLIQERLFEGTLRKNGGVPSAGQLNTLHDQAAQQLLQTSLAGAAFDKALTSGLASNGVRSSLRSHFVRMLELEATIIKRLQLTAITGLVAAIKKAGGTVHVSPRYGTWDPTSLALASDGAAGVPSFVALQGAKSSASPSQPTP